MGDKVGRSTLFGIPLQQEWSYARLRRLRADLLPADRRAALLLLVHRRVHRASAYRSLRRRTAGALRPDDHRLQSGRHVRRRSHPPRAEDLPRRVLRHRRVHDPQGVRLAEDRRRARQPRPTRRWTASSTSPARSGLVVILHNDIDMPFAKDGRRAGLPRADARRCSGAIPKTTIIWAHTGLGPRRPPGARTRRPLIRRRCSTIRRSATSTSTSRGTRWRSTSIATPETIARVAGADQPLPRPLPVRHRRGRAHRTAQEYLRVYEQYAPLWKLLSTAGCKRRSARATTSVCSTGRGQGARVGARPHARGRGAGSVPGRAPTAAARRTDCRRARSRCRDRVLARTLLPASSSGGEITAMPNLPGDDRDEPAADAALRRQARS